MPNDDPVQWGRANLAWTPDGYRLTLTIWLDLRASALFERAIALALRESFEELDEADLRIEFTGGHRWQKDRSAGAEPAELTIIGGRTLFAVPPTRLREIVSSVAARCRTEADEQHARDEELADDWLSKLRDA